MGQTGLVIPTCRTVSQALGLKWAMKGLVAPLALLPMLASADVTTRTVTYREGDTVLEGYLAYDSSAAGKRPGVLIIHDWNSIDDYERGRARQLAEMGYVAFALDVYGKDIRPKNAQESSREASRFKGDRALLRRRVMAGLEVLQRSSNVDRARIAAIGYCFGGTAALELARAGADIAGVVSFHGGLDNPAPQDARNIRAKVLVLHGADDPGVPPAQVQAFMDEMRAAKKDYQFVAYSGAVHAFTVPSAGNDPSKGAAYNAVADRRSWEHMKLFFAEVFKTGKTPAND